MIKRPKILYSWFWSDFWYNQISTRINNRNKWAIKAIPRQFNDLDTIYLNVLYAGIVSYVEEQKCFETVGWSETKQSKEQAKMIKKIYNWAKTGRNKFIQKIHESYPKIPKGVDILDWINNVDNKFGNDNRYDRVNRLEAELEQKDTEYLCYLISNRGILWT